VEEPAEPEEVEEPGNYNLYGIYAFRKLHILANCMKLCNRKYHPTCGYSEKQGYKTYSNPCMMEVISCEAGEIATKANDAVCGKKKTCFTVFVFQFTH